MENLEDIKTATSTDALTDMLAAYCQQEGIPCESADELLLRILDWKEWMQAFIEQWDIVQEHEDFVQAIAARGE